MARASSQFPFPLTAWLCSLCWFHLLQHFICPNWMSWWGWSCISSAVSGSEHTSCSSRCRCFRSEVTVSSRRISCSSRTTLRCSQQVWLDPAGHYQRFSRAKSHKTRSTYPGEPRGKKAPKAGTVTILLH